MEAVRIAMRRLGFDKLIDSKASRERDLVVAMVAGRIVAPQASKLAMTQALADTTLAEDLGVADADAVIGNTNPKFWRRNGDILGISTRYA